MSLDESVDWDKIESWKKSKIPNLNSLSSKDRALDSNLLEFLKNAIELNKNGHITRKRGKKLVEVLKATGKDMVDIPEPGPSHLKSRSSEKNMESSKDDDIFALCKCIYSTYRGSDSLCYFTYISDNNKWLCSIFKRESIFKHV